jgi:hypothetical protein
VRSSSPPFAPIEPQARTELHEEGAALLAFAAWLAGDGALAWCALDRCEEAEPGYRMAALLTHALAAALPPSSWRPLR